MIPPNLLLGLALASPGEPSRLELDVSGHFTYESISANPPLSTLLEEGHALGGGGNLSLTVFPDHPVYDDETPFSLQPFLQRTTLLTLSGGGGMFAFDQNDVASESSVPADASAAASGYVHPNVWLAGAVGFTYLRYSITPLMTPPVVQNPEYLSLPASIRIGFRWSDLLISVSYSAEPIRSNGMWQSPFWGGVGGHLLAVLGKHVQLGADIDAINGGISTSGSLYYYLSKRFGLFASVGGGHGQFFVNGTSDADRIGGDVGTSYWFSRHFGGSFTYTANWTQSTTSLVAHVFTLTLFSRGG